jgi:hypothetical protein
VSEEVVYEKPEVILDKLKAIEDGITKELHELEVLLG